MIQLSKDQIEILGRPNFTCMGLSALLVERGVYARPEKVRAESEQAIAIHFLHGMLEKHGENWRKEADKFIRDLQANNPASASTDSGVK